MDSPLPTEIMDDILSRLPVKPIMRFRRVSKSWRKLLSSPYFVDKHLKQQFKRTMVVTPEQMYSFDDGGGNNPPYRSSVDGVGVSEVKDYEVVWGCCDGLVCLGRCFRNQLCLWNPSTGKYKKLGADRDLVRGGGGTLWVVHGFGYNEATKDYQIVRVQCLFSLLDHETLPSLVQIYSLRNNTWRVLQEEINYTVASDQKGTLVKGSLHWIAARAGKDQLPPPVDYNLILGFDISREKFYEVPQGNSHSQIDCSEVVVDVVELDGKLGVIYDHRTRFELWVMKDYGSPESWSMLFNVIDPKDDLKLCGSIPLCFINDSQALLVRDSRKLFLCDLKARKTIPVEEFQIPLQRQNVCRAAFYVESLVALD